MWLKCVCVCACSVAFESFQLLDCSPPGSSVHGISQARILEWVAFPLPGDLPYLGIKPKSLVSPALTGRFFTTVPHGKPQVKMVCFMFCDFHHNLKKGIRKNIWILSPFYGFTQACGSQKQQQCRWFWSFVSINLPLRGQWGHPRTAERQFTCSFPEHWFLSLNL